MSDAVLHASKHDVFCRDCRFYAPLRREHRCRHPHAAPEVKTYEKLAKHFVEPEDKNAHNDCTDFKARRLQILPIEGVALVECVLLFGLFGAACLLFGVFSWVSSLVLIGGMLWILLRTC
jgi:hypothetical protein